MPTQFQSPELQAWASGFPVTLLHVVVTLLILAAGASLYALLTPHREIQLIREGNTAAALSFGGVLMGLAIPLAFAMSISTSLLEIALWGATTTAVQLALFWVTDLLLHGLPQRIKEGEIAAAALLVAAKLAVAAVLAAAVTSGVPGVP
jgi:putative membrane protein